jgi:hypothetical protein
MGLWLPSVSFGNLLSRLRTQIGKCLQAGNPWCDGGGYWYYHLTHLLWKKTSILLFHLRPRK